MKLMVVGVNVDLLGTVSSILTDNSTVPISKAWHCNVMEDNGQEVAFDTSGAILFEYTPFKVISFRIKVQTKNLK